MKIARTMFVTAAIILIVILLFESCSIYYKQPVSIEDAVTAENRVKILTKNGAKLGFKRLEMKEGKLYGHTHKNSRTANKFYNEVIEKGAKNNWVKIVLPEDHLKEIKLKNNSLSTAANISLAIVITAGVVIAIGELVSDSIQPTW